MSDEQPRKPPPPAGWYPDPKMPGTQRYWDGGSWSQHVAPVAPPVDRSTASGFAVWKITVGILAAVAILWFVVSLATADDDLDCARENVDRALNGQPALDCN